MAQGRSLEDADELPPPEELTTDAISELEGAVEELNAVLVLLENGNGASAKRRANRGRSRGQKTFRRPDYHQRPNPEHGPRGSGPAGDARFRSGTALRRNDDAIEPTGRVQS